MSMTAWRPNVAPSAERDTVRPKLTIAPGILAVLLALVILWVAVASGDVHRAGAVTALVINVAVGTALVVLSVSLMTSNYRRGQGLRGSGTLIVATINLAAVALPAVSLIWRTRQATVERLLDVHVGTLESLRDCLYIFTASMLAFACGELWPLVRRNRVKEHSVAGDSTGARPLSAVSGILIVVGLLAYVVTLSAGIGADFSTRGQATGTGVMDTLKWSLPLGIGIAVICRHFGSKPRVILSVLGILLIVLTGVRSPLILVAVAVIPRAIAYLAERRRPVRTVLVAIILADLLIGVGAGINQWRGSIRHGAPESLSSNVLEATLNPFQAMTESGTDTLDGILFVNYIDREAVPSSPFDLTKSVTYLIPRQIYTSKPPLLSNEISARYLKFGTGGMFMSGPGYLWIIFGSLGWALLGLFILGFIYRRLTARAGPALWLIASYVLVRFIMGGEALDFLKGFQLGLAYLAAVLAVKLIRADSGVRAL